MSDVLMRVAAILEERKQGDPDSSYVASLYAQGADAILKKVGEETAEVLIAAKNGGRGELVHEVADLWFHTLVLLTNQGAHPSEVLAELERRFGTSGHDEKAARGNRDEA